MRRIALVTDWFAPRQGGIETQLAELAQRLTAAGADVGVITATPGPEAIAPVAVRRLDVMTLPSPPLAISPALFGALERELRQGWDVVHAHVSVVSPTGWAAAWVARSLGLPCALTFHSVLRGKAVALRVLGAVAPIAESAIAWSAVSSAVAAQARWALGGGVDVGVLPNGVDLAWWQSGATQRRAVQAVTFVSAMRLHRKKRGRALVRAFASAARASARTARLVVFGDGPERNAIERDVDALGLREGPVTVELRGWLGAEALRAAYAEADAFVMASIHESFGIAALEASAAGLPIIARRSGITELVRHDVNGLIADSDDALSRVLRAFMTDDATRARLRPEAAMLSRFDWPAVVAAHFAEYERAIRRAASPARAVAASA